MKKNKSLRRLAITTGDQDGVGPEVTYKALAALGPCSGIAFVVFRSSSVSPRWLQLVEKSFRRIEVSSLEEAILLEPSTKTIVEVVSKKPSPLWVEEAAHAALKNIFCGIINAPLSKSLILASGLKEVGHTEILTRVAKSKPVTMSFWGPQFSVALASTHLPLKDVARSVSAKNLLHHLRQVALCFPRSKTNSLRVGVVGLNPHAGEGGLIGKEELLIFRPVLKKIRAEFPKVYFSEPLVPDAAFLKKNHKVYDVYFCPYHDQGLIPFKMTHGQSSGCQISLGLPFVRTSVDHGTAKELFGKNKADPGSMLDAIKMAVSLAKKHSMA